MHNCCGDWSLTSPYLDTAAAPRLIEMQALVTELIANFQFSLPKEKLTIKRAPIGTGITPMVVEREELNVAMPLRVSLV